MRKCRKYNLIQSKISMCFYCLLYKDQSALKKVLQGQENDFY